MNSLLLTWWYDGSVVQHTEDRVAKTVYELYRLCKDYNFKLFRQKIGLLWKTPNSLEIVMGNNILEQAVNLHYIIFFTAILREKLTNSYEFLEYLVQTPKIILILLFIQWLYLLTFSRPTSTGQFVRELVKRCVYFIRGKFLFATIIYDWTIVRIWPEVLCFLIDSTNFVR